MNTRRPATRSNCEHVWVQVFDPKGPTYYQQCAHCGTIG